MKKLLILLLFPLVGMAQQMELPSDYVKNVRHASLDKNGNSKDYIGNPYLIEKFTLGKVYITEDKFYLAKLRYNAYQDLFELKREETSDITNLFKDKDINIEIYNKFFQVFSIQDNGISDEKYFQVLNKGKIQLLKSETKKFVEAKKAASGYGSDKKAKFVDKIDYFIKNGSSISKIKLSKKSILTALESKKENASTYVKKNKLNLKKESDIIKLMDYLNSQS